MDSTAAIGAQLATAASDLCPLLDPQDVAASFGETVTLSTQPMAEAHGPACGVPHPRRGGYLLVVQFQDIAAWDSRVTTGRRVDGVGHPARIATPGGPSATLYVRDEERHAMVVFMAPQSDNAATAVLRFAASVYDVDAVSVIARD